MWVLGALDRDTGRCFLIPCPDNKRDAATLMPIICRWILPGSIVHTDEWGAYNSLTGAGYTHNTVNHTIQFVEPLSGTHTNGQEGLWYHAKKTIVGSRDLELSLIDFMFRRNFQATGGNMQIVNCFNGYLSVLSHDWFKYFIIDIMCVYSHLQFYPFSILQLQSLCIFFIWSTM